MKQKGNSVFTGGYIQDAGMDDKTVQRKLNQLVKIANELDQEATRRYGRDAKLFYEAEGQFHLMAGDDSPSQGSSISSRQQHVAFSSDGVCNMDCGAW
ncbi:hypothetical protein [Marinimicrobium sp. ABcell2]|uniref:hypothetical protein n=1 Tax=Marinimicrobium sp. ABcell2 TaxID=3069751 RepID=UPI0027ADC72A|nr:hypothetical protein [Marinimicrobium sp. ABcell2]MDQ2077505.1 hypothetical protein [Marinimicrobium sp. ABcell2]